jgi:sugar/nucleoside kinase (ribokinase family)
MKGLFIGTTTIDLIYPIDHFPEEDSKTTVDHQIIVLGGPATNAAITFSALGGQATLLSPVGRGLWATFIQQQLARYQVNHVDLTRFDSFVPPISSILVNQTNGLRTVFTSPGSDLGPVNEVKNKIEINTFDICCIDGFYADVVLSLLSNKAEKIPVVFDGGSYKYKTDKLLQFVDYPIFSERFTLPYGGSIASLIKDSKIDNYAITRGFKAIEMYQDKNRTLLKVPKIKAIDTLAAGDIFHGAFSYYLLATGGNFKKALEKSILIASLSCQFLGPVEWMKHLEKDGIQEVS